jgi:hypothetical protein
LTIIPRLLDEQPAIPVEARRGIATGGDGHVLGETIEHGIRLVLDVLT